MPCPYKVTTISPGAKRIFLNARLDRNIIMRKTAIRDLLESNYKTYHSAKFLRLDPLLCVQRYSVPKEIELAGLVASALAYGRAETIIRNIDKIIHLTGSSLTEFTEATSFTEKRRLFKGFKHRFNDGDDIALLFECAGHLRKEHGSLGSFFSKNVAKFHPTIERGLEIFAAEFIRLGKGIDNHAKESFSHLFPLPSKGSACKRMNMYLRWMIRPNDGIDFGIWKNILPAQLLIPIDTHVARIARELGFTKRKSADWTMVQEITSCLRVHDANDPIRFDFSLCHAGMIEFRKEAA
jgi:uncharacterized protein (TIGR02757 family)